ncbi:MMPL family transporter [Streptomyces sp. NPDC003691]
MPGRFGRLVLDRPWRVIGAALVLLAVAGAWGAGAVGELSRGFTNPGSESARAAERIDRELGPHRSDILVLYSSRTAIADEPAVREQVLAKARELRQRPEVARVETAYDTRSSALVSSDRYAQHLVVTLRGRDMEARADGFRRIEGALAIPGLTTRTGGTEAVEAAVNEHADGDLAVAQAVTLPVLLLLLVAVFGAVAAVTPLVLTIMAVCGAFAAVRLLTLVTEVSIFTVNIVVLLGLGLAVLYSLTVLARFREERAGGAPPREALAATLRTTGRTVALSALAAASLPAALLLFPQPFLRSMGYGGVAVALFAALAALTLLPALLAVLGGRADTGRIRIRRGARGTGADSGPWARLARAVGRRPVPYALVPVALLVLLAAPAAGAVFSGPDERVLPAGTESRTVAERIRSGFPGGDPDTVNVLVSGAAPAATAAYTERVRKVPGVTLAEPVARRGQSTLLRVHYTGESTSGAARALVRKVREVPPPPGGEALAGGVTAELVDLHDDMGRILPRALLLVAGATFAVALFALRSLRAAALSVAAGALSAAAAAGAVVLVFQSEPLSGPLDFTPTGATDAIRPVLVLAVGYALSAASTVVLLARVREERLRTGDPAAAVTAGLRRTGPVTTAAALALLVMVSGYAVNSVSMVKVIGVGLVVALVADTVVRALVLPAVLRLTCRAPREPGVPGPRGTVSGPPAPR